MAHIWFVEARNISWAFQSRVSTFQSPGTHQFPFQTIRELQSLKGDPRSTLDFLQAVSKFPMLLPFLASTVYSKM